MIYQLKRYDILLLPKNFITSFQATKSGFYTDQEEQVEEQEQGEKKEENEEKDDMEE